MFNEASAAGVGAVRALAGRQLSACDFIFSRD